MTFIGRTGSGKSTIFQSLMRMVLVQAGDITIGGESIFHKDLESVRDLFAYIPQLPVIFTGTVRENIDPYEQFSDNEVNNVMNLLSLKMSLNTVISPDSGDVTANLGMRITIASALLENKKYLLLDEVSSVLSSDEVRELYSVIRKFFPNAAVLDISHNYEYMDEFDRCAEVRDGTLLFTEKDLMLLESKVKLAHRVDVDNPFIFEIW